MDGKVAIVTGCARGLGAAQARLLAAEGARLIGTDLYQEEGEELIASLRKDGSEARFIHADATDPDMWDEVVALAVEVFGGIDVLVNNAGISARAFTDADDLAAWNTYLAVNATSVYLGSTRVSRTMSERGVGSIVNISSVMGIVGGPGHPGYYASKAAVRNFTKSEAIRLASTGVRVNSVHPGYMDPMRDGGAASRESRLRAAERIPLRRTGEALEVAYGVLFLASDESSYMTGSELIIDGGYLAQ